MDLHKQSSPEPPRPQAPVRQDAEVAPAELRASDAERDRIADILREAHAEGRLTAEEHAERIGGVYEAKTVGELEPLIRDLPGAHQRRPAPTRTTAPNRPADGEIPAEADDNVVAVFSASVRKGRWRAGRRIHAYAVFGSVEIDLSEALFEYPRVMIKAFSVFGSVEVRVPENVSLRGTGGGVLGNFEVSTLDSDDPDAPVVFIDGWAILGSVEARPKRGKFVANIADKLGISDKAGKGRRKTEKTERKYL
ncbi:DUF1707 domain-containing protein [Streptomyces sp. NPDC088789]|uniref:DUF1707 SHOCT-like domain-containing protein n=1 Tax=Streptomyces sp. NPDC088789 TaxID=3365899 RepID=UPI0037F99B24